MSQEQTPAAEAPENPQPTSRQRFTDRVWGLRAVIVVAVVALLLGGAVGAGLASLGGDDRDDRFGPGMHHRFDQGFMGRPGGPMMLPPGQRLRMHKRELRQFREFQQFRRWQRAHPGAVPSPGSGAQG